MPGVSYLLTVLGQSSPNPFPTYGSALSTQTPWYLISTQIGIFPSPIIGLAIVVGGVGLLALLMKGLPLSVLPLGVLVSLWIFSISFETFYMHLFIWLVPIMIILLAVSVNSEIQGIAYLLTFGSVAVATSFFTQWYGLATPYTGLVVFMLVLVPVFARWQAADTEVGSRRATEVIAASAGVLLFIFAVSQLGTWSHSTALLLTLGILLVALQLPSVFVQRPLSFNLGVIRPNLSVLWSIGVGGGALVLLYLTIQSSTSPIGVVLFVGLLVATVFSLARASWTISRWLVKTVVPGREPTSE
jgi:hypothetical protein